MIMYAALALLASVVIWRVTSFSMELPGSKKQVENPDKKRWDVKYLWSTLLIIGGVVLLYFGVSSGITLSLESPSLQTVSAFAQNYWLTIFLCYGVLALIALVALNVKSDLKAWSGTTQKILAGGVIMLLAVFPLSSWIVTPSEQRHTALENTLLAPANGDSPHLKTKPGHWIRFTGSGFVIHCRYRDGSKQVHTCSDGPMLYQYVTDTTGKPNTVTYEFMLPPVQ